MIGNGVLKSGFMSIFMEKDLVVSSQGIDIDAEEKSVFNIYKNDIIISGKHGVEAIDKNGNMSWSIPVSFSDIDMNVKNDYALAVDKGDKEAILIHNGQVKTNVKTQETIIMARLNNNGYFALITEERGYKGRLVVYNPEGTELFTNYSVNNIIDVDISNDNKRIAICTLDPGSGKVSGCITFYYLNSEQPYSGVLLEDTLLASIKFYKNRLIAVGDDKLVGFNSEGTKDWELKFEPGEIAGFNVDSDNMIVIITDENRNRNFFSNNIVKIIDPNGKVRGSYNAGARVSALSVLDDVIALGIKREVSILNSKGDIIAETEFSKDIVELKVFNNKRDLLIVSRNMLDVMQIK
jgi:hypothetical protein